MIQRLIPYSPEVYVSQLGYYYQATSPAHLVALGVGFLICVLLARHSARGSLITRLIIASFWVWTGAIFLGRYLAELNWAAEYFGYAFIAQGIVIGIRAVLSRDCSYQPAPKTRAIGCTFVIVAMILSPTIAAIMEAPIASAHLFGITPLPLIIATFGVFLVGERRTPIWLFAIPLLWVVWEGLGAETMGLWRDLVLAVISGCTGIATIVFRGHRTP